MIKLRNKARKNKSKEEYKKLRNECNKIVRRDKLEEAKKKIQDDPNNLWKVFNKKAKGQRKDGIKLKEDGKIIEDETEIADIFNNFFKEKIDTIKQSIEKCLRKIQWKRCMS